MRRQILKIGTIDLVSSRSLHKIERELFDVSMDAILIVTFKTAGRAENEADSMLPSFVIMFANLLQKIIDSIA